MTCYYAFNGDADGLCALQQLRLSETRRGTLVTGVKRDITLLRRIQEEAADVCTSIVVDRHIGGRYRAWAVVAAFGDNLAEPARAMALEAGLNAQATATLERLGICLNYNAYGESLEDLHSHPAELAELMMTFRDPADFIEQTEIYVKLSAG